MYASFAAHVNKSAIPFVAEKVVAIERSNVNVLAPVVVIIPHGAAQTVYCNCKARFLCDILEGPVSFVVVQRGIGLSGCMTRPIHRIYKQNVLPAIIVVIKHAYAAPHRFGQILLAKGPVVMFE